MPQVIRQTLLMARNTAVRVMMRKASGGALGNPLCAAASGRAVAAKNERLVYLVGLETGHRADPWGQASRGGLHRYHGGIGQGPPSGLLRTGNADRELCKDDVPDFRTSV